MRENINSFIIGLYYIMIFRSLWTAQLYFSCPPRDWSIYKVYIHGYLTIRGTIDSLRGTIGLLRGTLGSLHTDANPARPRFEITLKIVYVMLDFVMPE
jgi:hypothetical protein